MTVPSEIDSVVAVTMPQLGETVTEGTVTHWHKRIGDLVSEGEPLFEISTDKVDTEVPAVVTGRLVEIRAAVDETVTVGATLAMIDIGTAAAVASPAEPPKSVSNTTTRDAAHRPRHVASPRARRTLSERGLEVSDLTEAIPGARLTAADVRSLLRQREATIVAPNPTVDQAAVPAQSLGYISTLVDLRTVQREPLAVVCRAVVEAIGRYPAMNRRLGSGPQRAIHLAVGNTVVTDAGDKTLGALAREINNGTGDAIAATFEIQHPGAFGSVLSWPSLRRGTAAVLALDAVRPTPIAVAVSDGYAVAIRPVANLSVSYDASVLGVLVVAAFLDRVRALVESADWLDEL